MVTIYSIGIKALRTDLDQISAVKQGEKEFESGSTPSYLVYPAWFCERCLSALNLSYVPYQPSGFLKSNSKNTHFSIQERLLRETTTSRVSLGLQGCTAMGGQEQAAHARQKIRLP